MAISNIKAVFHSDLQTVRGTNMASPITTLFMLMSVDGEITPGATDDLDFNKTSLIFRE